MSCFRYSLFVFSFLFFLNSEAQRLNLKVVGKDSLETEIIRSIRYKSSFENLSSLYKEISVLQSKLQKRGYFENKVDNTSKINDSTYTSTVNLNRKYDTIYIYYKNSGFSVKELRAYSDHISEEEIAISIDQLETILNDLSIKLSSKGKPFSTLRLKNLSKRNSISLQAEIETNLSEDRFLDKVVIKGYEKFPRSFVKRFLKIKKGKPFDLQKIKQKTEALNNIRFANQTRSPEVLFTKDSTELYLYLEKTKSNTFDGFIGFGTDEETNKLQFDGYLNLNLLNAFNYGEQIQLNYKSDESEQKTFNINLQLPYLFGSSIGTELGLNIFRKDSSFTSVNQDVDIFYQINDKHRLGLGINAFKSNDLLDAGMSLEDLDAVYFKLNYHWIDPQYSDLLFPVKFQLRANVGFGERAVNTSKLPQQRFNLETFKIFNLNDKNSIYGRITSGGIFSDNYFDNELLRFGGINSIRGFEENTLVASLFAVLNTEYRYRLNNSIYVHSIFDASYFENELTDQKEKLFGYGFGFGIFTKAGLLKFNFANAKIEGQKFKISNSKIHLSLNALF